MEHLICALTGAEAAIAVNNNAAAVMMVLAEFAAGHEAIVSRGELVEIGGSFRVPDIMAQSSARMVEVGATNKTHAFDYERAITPDTAMLLKVHPSNYRMIGFTESVSEDRPATHRRCGKRPTRRRGRRPPRAARLRGSGSGAFMHLDVFGEYAEPTVRESLAEGCDLVSFSGDKLLGGPQAGIVVGRKDYIDRLKKHPLARALRLDKMTLAALEATLRLYLDPEDALRRIPTLRMLTEDAETVRERAEALMAAWPNALRSSRRTWRSWRRRARRRRIASHVRHPHVLRAHALRGRQRARLRGAPPAQPRRARDRAHQARMRAVRRAHHHRRGHPRDRLRRGQLFRGLRRAKGVVARNGNRIETRPGARNRRPHRPR